MPISGPVLSSTTPAAVGTAAVGTGTTAARADHVHAHGNQAAGTSLHAACTTSVNGFMSAGDKTKLDAIATSAAALGTGTPENLGTPTAGNATTAAPFNHVHGHGAQAGGTLHAEAVASGAAGFLSGADKAKIDGVAPGATANTLAVGATAPANVQKQTAAAGASTQAARVDHLHDVATATCVTIGTANAEGASASLARADHVHAHGDQVGGTMHAVAVAGGAAGFLSGVDKTKLDALGSANLALGNFDLTGVRTVLYTVVDDGSSGAADTIDWSAGGFHTWLLTGNAVATFTPPAGPTALTLKVVQDATGGRVITLPSTVKNAAAVIAQLVTTANTTSVLTFLYDGTNYYGAVLCTGVAA